MSLDLARATGHHRELAVAGSPPPPLLRLPPPSVRGRVLGRGRRAWAGAGAGTVLYTNPVKPAGDIARAWRAGVWRFAADTGTELHKIAENAPGAAVLFRLAPSRRRAGGTVSDRQVRGAVQAGARTGAACRFAGPDPVRAGVPRRVADDGSRSSDGPIRQCARIMTELAADGIRLEMLDLGGGFPVRYDADPPPLAEYAAVISRAVAQLPYPVQLACEPGRAIAAPAGTMVASVIGVASQHSTVRVSLDTGAFHGLIEALESGRELRFPVTIPTAGCRMLVPCTLTGPSCDSQDTILNQVWLPEPQAGDQVLIGNAGACSTCYSGRSAFNGYPGPGIGIMR